MQNYKDTLTARVKASRLESKLVEDKLLPYQQRMTYSERLDVRNEIKRLRNVT